MRVVAGKCQLRQGSHSRSENSSSPLAVALGRGGPIGLTLRSRRGKTSPPRQVLTVTAAPEVIRATANNRLGVRVMRATVTNAAAPPLAPAPDSF